MNILVLGSEVPATANMPGSPRLFSLCRILAQRHRLTLVTLGHGSERYDTFDRDPLAQGVFEKVTILPETPDHGWWGQQRHRLRQEASFVTRTRTPAYFAAQQRRILSILSAGKFDVVYADGLPVSQYLTGLAIEQRALIDLHDCFTLLFRRTMEAERNWIRKLAIYSELRSIARLETSLSRTFARIVFNSSVDEAFLKGLDPSASTQTIGNGVDGDYFTPGLVEPDYRKLVFTGVMGYGPNEDAAIYFAESILPLIQERRPDIEFWVVGKAPSARVRALATRPGVHVTGAVPDVRPFLQDAGIFVCPLRFGAGIKNKLLAALATRRAVVATPLSVEGLDLQDGKDLLVAEGPHSFADRVLQLIDDPNQARGLAATGQASVKAMYSWEHSARLLEEALTAITHES